MRAPVLFATALLTFAPGLARADSANEPPEENYDCSIKESCPDSGVLCEEVRCGKDQQCPSSGVDCDRRDDATYTQCEADAEAAGLELRCDGGTTVYCDAGEGPPAGGVVECHAKQKAAGLSKRCEDEHFSVIYCDPKEKAPGAESETSSGCMVESPRRSSGLSVALVVFGVAATAAALRARKRRAG